MPANNSASRPKNRDEKKETQKYKDIRGLERKLTKQYVNGEITKSAFDKALKKLQPAKRTASAKGIQRPLIKEADRKASKKYMVGLSKGGMVSCGASMKPGQKRTK